MVGARRALHLDLAQQRRRRDGADRDAAGLGAAVGVVDGRVVAQRHDALDRGQRRADEGHVAHAPALAGVGVDQVDARRRDLERLELVGVARGAGLAAVRVGDHVDDDVVCGDEKYPDASGGGGDGAAAEVSG